MTGRVWVAGTGDSVPAAGALVTLHRVASDSQGPVAELTAGNDGRFRFRRELPAGGVLLVSARWHGIEYFAPPVDSATPVSVVVNDTSSSAPVEMVLRSVIVGGPAPDGTRDVIDLMIIRNAGVVTRVPPDSLAPSLVVILPPNAANLRISDADFVQDAADLHGDTLYVHAPLPPGDRQVMLQYQIAPATRTFEIPVSPVADTAMVLAEETGLLVRGEFARSGAELIEGKSFSRWSAGNVAVMELVLPGGGTVPGWLVPVMLALVGAGLAAITVRALLSARPR